MQTDFSMQNVLCHAVNTYTFNINVSNANFSVCISTARCDAYKMNRILISIWWTSTNALTIEMCNSSNKNAHYTQSLLRYVLDCLTTEFPRVANVVNEILERKKTDSFCISFKIKRIKSKLIFTHFDCSVVGLDRRQSDLCEWNPNNLNTTSWLEIKSTKMILNEFLINTSILMCRYTFWFFWMNHIHFGVEDRRLCCIERKMWLIHFASLALFVNRLAYYQVQFFVHNIQILSFARSFKLIIRHS